MLTSNDQIIYIQSDSERSGIEIQNETQFIFYNEFNLLAMKRRSFCNNMPTIDAYANNNPLWIFTNVYGNLFSDSFVVQASEVSTENSAFIPFKKVKSTRKMDIGLYENFDIESFCSYDKLLMLNREYSNFNNSTILHNLFKEGWYAPENNLVWSKKKSSLMIDSSLFDNDKQPNELIIYFDVFGDLSTKPNMLNIRSCSKDIHLVSDLKNKNNKVSVRLENFKNCNISFNLNYIESPYNLNISDDTRKLGLAVRSILFK